MTVEVGIRELKNALSRYLARVRAGEEVVVTDRGKVIARLVGVPSVLDRLFAEGRVERAPNVRKHVPAMPTVRLRGDGPTMVEYVADQRR